MRANPQAESSLMGLHNPLIVNIVVQGPLTTADAAEAEALVTGIVSVCESCRAAKHILQDDKDTWIRVRTAVSMLRRDQWVDNPESIYRLRWIRGLDEASIATKVMDALLSTRCPTDVLDTIPKLKHIFNAAAWRGHRAVLARLAPLFDRHFSHDMTRVFGPVEAFCSEQPALREISWLMRARPKDVMSIAGTLSFAHAFVSAAMAYITRMRAEDVEGEGMNAKLLSKRFRTLMQIAGSELSTCTWLRISLRTLADQTQQDGLRELAERFQATFRHVGAKEKHRWSIITKMNTFLFAPGDPTLTSSCVLELVAAAATMLPREGLDNAVLMGPVDKREICHNALNMLALLYSSGEPQEHQQVDDLSMMDWTKITEFQQPDVSEFPNSLDTKKWPFGILWAPVERVHMSCAAWIVSAAAMSGKREMLWSLVEFLLHIAQTETLAAQPVDAKTTNYHINVWIWEPLLHDQELRTSTDTFDVLLRIMRNATPQMLPIHLTDVLKATTDCELRMRVLRALEGRMQEPASTSSITSKKTVLDQLKSHVKIRALDTVYDVNDEQQIQAAREYLRYLGGTIRLPGSVVSLDKLCCYHAAWPDVWDALFDHIVSQTGATLESFVSTMAAKLLSNRLSVARGDTKGKEFCLRAYANPTPRAEFQRRVPPRMWPSLVASMNQMVADAVTDASTSVCVTAVEEFVLDGLEKVLEEASRTKLNAAAVGRLLRNIQRSPRARSWEARIASLKQAMHLLAERSDGCIVL